ncbi:hypothetical protein MLD38_021488 [Melastoma candidum]|uniref:Uncharacterized protein n=1 Tax=Melastoma candidum TaxID=119954 RepID=A0ACB9QH67_9MYRT|nr:hypothetical protein MLD38_021488 [Melastoma candidum]
MEDPLSSLHHHHHHHHQSYLAEFYESCLGNPFPSEDDLCFSKDRLFQIETEFARSLEHSDQDGASAFLEESPLSLPMQMPGEETSPIDLLLMGAEAIDVGDWGAASGIMARLNVMLPGKENGGGPFDRLAFYFAQALDLRCSDSICGMLNVASCGNEIAASGHDTTSTICAVQMVQELSPYMKFAHFTANQAILEATWSDRDVHVVDFDIMEGIQWPPLMGDLAARDSGCSLRITAVIAHPGDARRSSRTGRRLKEFAGSIGLDFEFDQFIMTKEEDFRNVKADGCHRAIVANCMSHQVHTPHRSPATVCTFLKGVTTIMSPKVVSLVQDELHDMTRTHAKASFVDFFCEAVHHYMAVSESLARGFGGGYGTWLKLVENEMLGPRIMECLRGFPSGADVDRPGLDGYETGPISEKNVAQAKFLVGLFCRDYWVQNEKERRVLSLCWRSRPIVTASIWAPIRKAAV